ncbi:MAG: pyruvate, orthophosphate dikinase [Eubacteriaceae bacterium]|nr:pyruvate, orthophosphate dikinase [Eubacteriaceae bacterium]
MAKTFSSKALTANLTQTQDENIIIPDNQKWFGQLSKEYLGVYNHTQKFLIELNHAYCDKNYVLDVLQTICLDDSKIYENQDESNKAFLTITEILEVITKSKLNERQREHLISIHIRFIDHLAKMKKPATDAILELLNIFERNIEEYELLYLKQSGLIKIYFE